MDIQVANQRILVFKAQLSQAEAQEKAWHKKSIAFDPVSKVTSFLSRPKDDDFKRIYQEYRFEPFWHVITHARYVYDRSTQYQISGLILQEFRYSLANHSQDCKVSRI